MADSCNYVVFTTLLHKNVPERRYAPKGQKNEIRHKVKTCAVSTGEMGLDDSASVVCYWLLDSRQD